MSLATVADELYALTPREFTAARNARAKEARARDKGLGASVKALPKPSTAAWAVNMLVRRQADQLDQVLALGSALRQAQENLDGDELRKLTRQRRELTAAVANQARELALELGVQVSDAVAVQVEDTLRAAMLDDRAAEAVRTGQLVTTLSATGLDEVDLSESVAVPESIGIRTQPVEREKPTLRVVEEDPDDTAARALEEAQGTASEAAAAADKSQRKLAKAKKRVAKLEARHLQLLEELDEVRRRAGELEHEVEAVDADLAAAEEKRDHAEQKQDAARRAADEAQAAARKLEPR
jgi:chromosome segregation ATPase